MDLNVLDGELRNILRKAKHGSLFTEPPFLAKKPWQKARISPLAATASRPPTLIQRGGAAGYRATHAGLADLKTVITSPPCCSLQSDIGFVNCTKQR